MGVKAQSVDGKKSTCFFIRGEQQAASWLFMYSASRYSIFILFTPLIISHLLFPRKTIFTLYVYFHSPNAAVRKGHCAAV